MTTFEWVILICMCFLVLLKLGLVHFICGMISPSYCASCSNEIIFFEMTHKLNYGYDELKPIKVCDYCYELRYGDYAKTESDTFKLGSSQKP